MNSSISRIVRSFALVAFVCAASSRCGFAQNFDPDSFNKPAKFAGAYAGAAVLLEQTPGPTPAPAGTAVVAINPQPATTSWDLQDVGKFVIPKNTAHSIFYFIPLLQQIYHMENNTGSPGNGSIIFSQTVTIENAALNDPSVIDPMTGLPANGKLINIGLANLFQRSRSLQPGENDSQSIYYTRASFGAINRQFFLNNGVPNNVVDKIFKNDTTFHINMSGSAAFVTGGSNGIQFRVFVD